MMQVGVQKRRFTVDEFHRMGEAGILSEDDRVELIDGEIVEMTPIGPRHASCVRRLNAILARLVGDSALVDVQNPVVLGSHDEPQPDIVLLASRQDFYRTAHPGPGDTHLVIEVADSSIDYDRGRKLRRYAIAGVREVWIVNLGDDLVEVFRQVSAGEYREHVAAGHGQSLPLPGPPDRVVQVDDILG